MKLHYVFGRFARHRFKVPVSHSKLDVNFRLIQTVLKNRNERKSNNIDGVENLQT